MSGYPANYWINRYTALDIARLLRDKTLTFVQISDMFRFSSPAYFSRYVQRMLGVNPTRYRAFRCPGCSLRLGINPDVVGMKPATVDLIFL